MPEWTFEEVCHQHHPRVVRSVFLMLGDQQEAQDVAQEAFVRAFERWEHVSGLDRPELWIQKVATNLALSSLRRRRRGVPFLQRIDDQVSETPLPDPDLRQALLGLAPAQRSVVVLRFYLDWSVAETARALGRREGTVRALTSQALARLREKVPEVSGE